jgi:hypothetical protein
MSGKRVILDHRITLRCFLSCVFRLRGVDHRGNLDAPCWTLRLSERINTFVVPGGGNAIGKSSHQRFTKRPRSHLPGLLPSCCRLREQRLFDLALQPVGRDVALADLGQ